MIRLNSTHLSPFINYTVTLIANNRAGASPSTIQGFQTLQAGTFIIIVVLLSYNCILLVSLLHHCILFIVTMIIYYLYNYTQLSI